MTQRTTSAHTPLRCYWLRLLLTQSLSWLGVLSLLSSNLVLAQTDSSSIDAIGLPSTKDSKPPVAPRRRAVAKPALDKIQSAPAAVRREQLRQKLLSSQVLLRQEQPRPQVSDSPAPKVLAPKVRLVVKPPTNLPSSVQAQRTRRLLEKTAAHAAPDYSGAYIDPTDYKIGATRDYSAPSAVVVSERSTGCKAILRLRQGVSGSLCGSTPQRRTLVAVRRTKSIYSVLLPRPQAPSWARRNQAVAVRGILPVRLGPISVSSSGFGVSRRTPTSFQGKVALGNGMPSQPHVVYYNPTIPATGQPSSANPGLMFPLTIPAPITSLFGWRIHPITGNRQFHAGTDFGAPLGTPVLAAYAGKVAIADFLGGYGLAVVLEHNQSSQQTLYGHLSEIFVQPGEWVEQGTVIGRVGSTGNSTGPHLHFETRQLTPEGWVATDPGVQLKYALAGLVQALHTAQAPQPAGS